MLSLLYIKYYRYIIAVMNFFLSNFVFTILFESDDAYINYP